MSRPYYRAEGFSLVEVTLALGVATFCLIGLIGLLPLGVQANQSSVSQTAAASMLSSVVAYLRATPKTSPTSPQHEITFGIAKTLYFDGEGAVVSMEANATPRYRVTITFPSSPAGPFAPTFVSLKVSWPALADPTTATRRAPLMKAMLVLGQAEQPEPQPPTAPSASAPSSTWKEWPQPQEELAFGLLIANPAAWMEST